MKAGFLGVGNMGGAIARRLLAEGVSLCVFDPDVIALEALGRSGVTRCDSPKDVADRVSIVFSCLPSVAIAEEAALGNEGAIHGSAIKTYVELSTIGAPAARANALRFHERGIGFVDAPVSGGAAAADAGSLTVMLAAPDEQIDAVRPTLQRLTDRLIVVGEAPGAGQTMKLMNNLLVAANTSTFVEVLVLGTKLGLDPAMIVNVVGVSAGRSLVSAPQRMKAIVEGTFDTGPRLSHLCKDIHLAQAQIEDADIALDNLPGIEGMIALWNGALEEDLGDHDVTAIIKVVEARLGVEARSKTPIWDNGPMHAP